MVVHFAPSCKPDALALIRGGHLDLCVLGAFKVAENGGVANWSTSDNESAKRIYTNLAVIDVTDEGFVVRDVVKGLTLKELQDKTAAPLHMATQ
jgi:3-oxoadipate CoA-transferase, beta subunit